jgi:hypothetical protein
VSVRHLLSDPVIVTDSYSFSISEWWSKPGTYHYGQPSEWQLLNQAVQMTGELEYKGGGTYHYTLFSHDGWLPSELESEVDDAAGYYEEMAG